MLKSSSLPFRFLHNFRSSSSELLQATAFQRLNIPYVDNSRIVWFMNDKEMIKRKMIDKEC